MSEEPPRIGGSAGRKPEWLKQRLPKAKDMAKMTALLRERGLHTVCESASCPNVGTCFSHGTATFLIMGDICTRQCRFCGITSGRPGPLDEAEPRHVAEAAAHLGLQHVVVTSVTRDDLADGGAAHYVATIEAVRAGCPGVTVEVLVPDFQGDGASLDAVLDAVPEVFNHNLETVPRLYEAARPQAGYRRSLEVLGRAAARGQSAVKTGLMVGLGESGDEMTQVMRDIAELGVTMLTIGQYLQPAHGSLPVAEFVKPAVFAEYAEFGETLGLLVHAAPFVRSSYRAGETIRGGERPKRKIWRCRATIARTPRRIA